MPSPSRRTSRFSLGAEVLLAGLLVLGPLALGGAPSWMPWPLVGFAAVAAVLASVGARRQGRKLHVPLLALPFVAGAGLCLVQLVPLPPGWLAWVSPEAAALREFALVPLGFPAAGPVSLDPPATWRELAKSLAYALVFLAAVEVCRSQRSRRRLLATLAFTGAGVALVGLGHAMLGLDLLFGVRTYAHVQPPLVTPFGNPNHLAGFLGLSATVALGLALTQERLKRVAFFASAVLSGVGVLLSLSRAGIFFFLVGQVLVALGVLRQRRPGSGRRPSRSAWGGGLAVLLVLCASLGAGGYVAWEKLVAEASTARSVETLRRGKVELWPMMAEAAWAFPVLGMGRGAFEAAFPRYQSEPNPNTLTHPENAVLQLAAEFGVPGLVLLAVMGWGFARLLFRRRLERVELAVLAGVFALGLHNLFDFSLELPACAVAALVALATVVRPEAGERPEGAVSPARWSLSPRWAVAGAVGFGLLGFGALVPGRHTLAASEAELTALIASRAPLEEVRARGLSLIGRHPADYLLYGLVGTAYTEAGDARAGEALAFINRALYLKPVDAGAHRVAARALLVLGHRQQAFLEYRLAREAGDSEALSHEALRQVRTVEELQTLTPEKGALAWELAAALVAQPAPMERTLAWFAWAREHFATVPGSESLWMDEVRLRLGRGELREAEGLCDELEQRVPDKLEYQVLRAELLRAQGQGLESIQRLERLVPRYPEDVGLAFTLASQLLEAGLTRRAREVLGRATPFVMDSSQRARLLTLEGACFEREGLLSRALERYQTVTWLIPSAEAHFTVARLQEAMGRYGDAARSVREGGQRLPVEARKQWEPWVARLEDRQRQLMEDRRQELLSNPHEQEAEHLLRTAEEPP
ncbi:O-antigen polymerase family protein [Stigmatella aurantiaca DW4/3-1]|uniref:O-antigen polymerase family protein n=3 Tax=Stigmatella aurantiaca TaxID=41 RepID=E3FNY5_STIAD|nr:O-antigen polymerase family protein [Stigmatella aurantiaca DW4/3-1]